MRYLRMLSNAIIAGLLGAAYLAVLVGLTLYGCVVSVGGQRPRQQHARLSGFIRSLDLAPGANALPQGGDRLLGVAAVERQMPARDGRGGGRS